MLDQFSIDIRYKRVALLTFKVYKFSIWLYSIRKQLEELDLKAELYGYDLHDNQFPPEDRREDVELHTLNILDTPKFQEMGPTYHYIHARLLTSVLTKEEWKVAIDNCLEILSIIPLHMFRRHGNESSWLISLLDETFS